MHERDAFNPYHRYLELRTSWEVIKADAPLPVFLMPERKAANCPGPRTEPGQSRTALHRLTRSLQQHAALLQATHPCVSKWRRGQKDLTRIYRMSVCPLVYTCHEGGDCDVSPVPGRLRARKPLSTDPYRGHPCYFTTD